MINKNQITYPHLFQELNNDCGIKCLEIISIFFGLRVKKNINIHHDGLISIFALGKLANDFGFNSLPLKVNFTELDILNYPFIALIKSNHYVVVFKIEYDSVTYSDPSKGIVIDSVNSFLTKWRLSDQKKYGVLLNLTPKYKKHEPSQINTPKQLNTGNEEIINFILNKDLTHFRINRNYKRYFDVEIVASTKTKKSFSKKNIKTLLLIRKSDFSNPYIIIEILPMSLGSQSKKLTLFKIYLPIFKITDKYGLVYSLEKIKNDYDTIKFKWQNNFGDSGITTLKRSSGAWPVGLN